MSLTKLAAHQLSYSFVFQHVTFSFEPSCHIWKFSPFFFYNFSQFGQILCDFVPLDLCSLSCCTESSHIRLLIARAAKLTWLTCAAVFYFRFKSFLNAFLTFIGADSDEAARRWVRRNILCYFCPNPVVFYRIITAGVTVHMCVTSYYPVVVGNIHLAPEELC